MLIFYLVYIVSGSILLPLLVAAYRYRMLPAALKLLFFFLLAAAIINATGIIVASYHHPNLWLLHIYTAMEAVFLLLFFRHITPRTGMRKVISILLFLFPLWCMANMLFVQPFSRFNSYPRSAEALLFILLGVHYWLTCSDRHEYSQWTEHAWNWIISGILLYFSSSFFLFLFSDVMLLDKQIRPSAALTKIISFVWATHGTLVIIQYILFTIGFIKYRNDQ